MSSTRRKQNNPTKSASDIKKKARVSRSTKTALTGEDEPSLARSRPQRKIIPKRPLSPDIELSSRRKRRRKKKVTQTKPKAHSQPASITPTHAVHIKPNELKPPKLSKQHKASLKKKKKRKKKTFVFPILASDRVPRDQTASPSSKKSDPDIGGIDLGSPGTSKSKSKSSSKKKAKPMSKNVLDVGQLRMLPAADLVRKFAKHTSFKVPSEDNRPSLKQHVYTCRMLPHYCTEKFYGNEEDTKRQITKHLLRHVGELLTVTNRGLNLMSPPVKKQKQEKAKKKAVSPDSEDANSTMYILPSAPRPMRVTLHKHVSSRMKRSSYTVIRSGESDRGVNEVVLLPKGRLLGILNTSSKNLPKNCRGIKEGEGDEDDEGCLEDGEMITEDELLQASSSSRLNKGEANQDGATPGLSIEFLAEAVEAMVNKESQSLNLKVAEALAKELQAKEGGMHDGHRKKPASPSLKIKKAPSISSSSSGSITSAMSTPSSSPDSSPLKSPVKGKKVTKGKKSLTLLPTAVSNVQCPHPDHNYALTINQGRTSEHLDSEGRPLEAPHALDEADTGWVEGSSTFAESMNDQLNKLIADMNCPQPLVKVSNENDEPVVGEGANVTVEHVEDTHKKQKKIKLKVVPSVSMPSEEVKQTALQYLQLLNKNRKRQGPFECLICNKHLTAASTLRAHYRSHAGIKPYQCELCQATFTRLHSLKYHTMIHNKEARFLCSYCQRQFRHSSHYREHLRRHTGEEPFGCSDCSARFKTRNTYKRHLRSKHGKVVTEDGKINLAPNMFPATATATVPAAAAIAATPKVATG